MGINISWRKFLYLMRIFSLFNLGYLSIFLDINSLFLFLIIVDFEHLNNFMKSYYAFRYGILVSKNIIDTYLESATLGYSNSKEIILPILQIPPISLKRLIEIEITLKTLFIGEGLSNELFLSDEDLETIDEMSRSFIYLPFSSWVKIYKAYSILNQQKYLISKIKSLPGLINYYLDLV